MIIGIDIRHLAARQSGGIAEYTVRLIDALAEKFGDTAFKLFYTGKTVSYLENKWKDRSNITIKHIRLPNRLLDPSFRFLNIPYIDRLMGGVDVFLSPHFLLTAVDYVCPRVLVIHDLSFVRFPELFSFQDRLWLKLMNPKKQAQKARTIITVSQATKNDLINIWNIDGEKIKVVYPGIINTKRPEKSAIAYNEVRKKYNLPDNYILALSVVEPRKNYLNLIKAFEVYKNSGAKTAEKAFLVIAGPIPDISRNVVAAAKRSRFAENIIFTGFIEEDDKPYIFAMAEIFVYPSLFEGFGFPPLEAMVNGVPVIVSDRSSLPEITDGAAIIVDPYDISAMALSIRELMDNKQLHSFFAAKGEEKAGQYDWRRSADEIYKILKSVVSESRYEYE